VIPFIPSGCTDEQLQAEARAHHEANERALLEFRLREWQVPAPDREAILRGEPPKRLTPALSHARAFGHLHRHWALVLWGGHRVGKTYAALRWLVEAAKVPMSTLEHGETWRYSTTARFIPFALLAQTHGSHREHQALLADALKARALVLDDVSTEHGAAAPVLDLITYTRHQHRRPTLITTRLGPELFGRPDQYGRRIVLCLQDRGSFRGCGGDDEREALSSALEGK
jgi:hypothetical protein